jgi:immune inhibitor A
MTAMVNVQCGKSLVKDNKDRTDKGKELDKENKETKDRKDLLKEGKELSKENKETKDRKDSLKETKEGKELSKENKETKDRKDLLKERSKEQTKELSKERKDFKDRFELAGAVPGGIGAGTATPYMDQAFAELEARVAALEAAITLGQEAQPFVGNELRPDLAGGPDYSGSDDLQARMASGDRDAKMSYDTLPPA